MPKSRLRYLMLLALIMFVAKPFVGFSLRYEHYFKALHHRSPNILVKSFTKRKLEFSEDSEFNMAATAKKLANPVLPTLMLLACVLDVFLTRFFKETSTTTYGYLAALFRTLFKPRPLYLLSGKLTI